MQGQKEQEKERVLIVKRKDLTFDKKKCQLINFSDMSTYVWLKQEQENTRLLTMLNTTVHHEMLAPLEVTNQVADYLVTKIEEQKDKKLVEAIKVSNRMMQLNIQDLLDNRLI